VPIALFVHTQTGEVLRDPAVDARVLAAFRTDGADAWWARDAADFLGPAHDATDYEQVFDIVDVWFESGATHAFVLEARGMPWPADLYLEGSDQHRGWFQSSLLEACATRGAAPYRAVLTHGFIVDERGYKMSKSRGNVIAPEDLIATYGADIVRLWAITVDYTRDVPVGDALLKSVADLYRRLRGTLRFLLGALDGFTPAERVAPADMPALERYILSRLAALDAEIQRAQSGYTFGAVAHALHQFCNADLSAFYFDIRKDCLYCDAPDDHKRKSARSVLEILFDALVTRLAPIAPFTAEEAWAHRPPALRAPPPAPPLSGGGGAQEAADSVHLRTFAPIDPAWADGTLDAQWARLRDVRRVVLGAMEPYRKDKTIGSSLEAAPVVHAAPDWAQALQGVDLAEVCITSAAPTIHDPAPADAFALEGVPGVAVAFARAPGAKCARCWKVLPEVTGDLCPRCARVLAGGPS
jgi:isoleucyl-tRNA synthetase